MHPSEAYRLEGLAKLPAIMLPVIERAVKDAVVEVLGGGPRRAAWRSGRLPDVETRRARQRSNLLTPLST